MKKYNTQIFLSGLSVFVLCLCVIVVSIKIRKTNERINTINEWVKKHDCVHSYAIERHDVDVSCGPGCFTIGHAYNRKCVKCGIEMDATKEEYCKYITYKAEKECEGEADD